MPDALDVHFHLDTADTIEVHVDVDARLIFDAAPLADLDALVELLDPRNPEDRDITDDGDWLIDEVNALELSEYPIDHRSKVYLPDGFEGYVRERREAGLIDPIPAAVAEAAELRG